MKKITAVLLIGILMIACGGIVSAYTADDVFTALEEANVPEAYILQAEAYFEESPMTEEQAGVIMGHIDAALEIAGGKTKASELTSEQRADIFMELVEAGQVLDLVVTYEGNTSYETGIVYVRDQNDDVIFMVTAEDVIKHTGFDYTIVLIGLGVLVLAGAAALLLRRRQSVEDAA